jgi:SWI/SNF-related matrix-associated actin-dependent regulator of chromatin subfamily A-like protein 1
MAISPSVKNSKHTVLITGTPSVNRPIELFSQIDLLVPKWFDLQEFRYRYCDAKETTFCIDVNINK